MRLVGRLFLSLALCITALAANFRLFLKDGQYHIVREYQVNGDRVRYYSTERGDWEEIPLTLVDLKKTESVRQDRQEELAKEAKLIGDEEKAERQRADEIAKIPQGPGVYLVQPTGILPLKQAESKIHENKRRSILKVLAPIPIVAGKSTVELDGEKAELRVSSERPEFYIALSAEERFGIAQLTPDKGIRIVENVTKVPVSNELIEELNEVDVFRQQIDGDLYKIWPQKPLSPGEYAIVQYTAGKMNIQVWDFGYDGKSK